ncbi:MAG: putative lipid II flippase FtsW [Ilumatobacter coccineus]|uniref:Probable peptidoglycan glycosyltransferase FtsW n=1 Tax=Ilumatobacter coccineus TaxID=467094 RepID=A0A2G6KAV5_9ACTN|nr:MAG: putative lipid II flippase FtsW [Ilumatobacter coccineus]
MLSLFPARQSSLQRTPRTHGERGARRHGLPGTTSIEPVRSRAESHRSMAPTRRMKRTTGPSRLKVRSSSTPTRQRRDLSRSPRRSQRLGPPPTAYYGIALIVAVLVMLGLVMVLSVTSAASVGTQTSAYAVVERQLGWAVIGLTLMVLILKIDYGWWRRVIPVGMALSAAAMLLPFAPGIGGEINDARSWVWLGPVSFQPVEFMKLATIAMLAYYLADQGDRVRERRYGIIPTILILGFGVLVSLVQKDIGSAVVLAGAGIGVAVIAGVPFTHLTITSLAGMLGLIFLILHNPRGMARVTSFFNPEATSQGAGYQSRQGQLSIANGHLFGAGIGASRFKRGYLPYAESDFIFAIIAEELGLIGSIAVIGGFAILVWFGVQTALAAPDRFGMLLAGGIATWFGVQAGVNLAGVAGVLPVTGITLPFISKGGSSLIVSLVAAGLLLNIARRARTSDLRLVTKGT